MFDNIASPLRVLKPKISKEQITERVHEVAKMLRITELLDRKPSALSGGQQQRVAIARSLSRSSDLILLDEPFAGVDMSTETAIFHLLQEMATAGKTVIVVHHDIHGWHHVIQVKQRLAHTHHYYVSNRLITGIAVTADNLRHTPYLADNFCHAQVSVKPLLSS